MDNEKELIAILQAIPWFQTLSDEHLNNLVEIAHLVYADAGEDLFKEGDKEDYLYVLLEGRVGVDIYSPVRGRMRIYTIEPVDVVGWSSATPVVRQRIAGVKAVLDSRLVAFDSLKLRQLSDADPEFGYVIMRRMANVVAARLMVTRLQLLDLFAHPDEGTDNG